MSEVTEVVTEEVVAEAAEQETVAEEVTEEVVAEAAEQETVAEEVTEEAVAETVTEEATKEAETATETVVVEEVGTMKDLGEDLEKSLQAGPPKNDEPAWDKALQYLSEKTVFEVSVDSVVKKGVVAFVDELRAFIPASKLSTKRVENLDELKGKKLNVMVIEADPEGKKLILSARDAQRAAKREARAMAEAAIEEGAELTGKVESLKDYGAFIDLENGASGLLHVSQISYKRVNKPEDVLSVGQEVKVKVIGKKEGKISLSMKALEPAPEKKERKPREDGERRSRKEDHVEHIEKEKAITSMASLLSGIKID